jgi:hypothetical protein
MYIAIAVVVNDDTDGWLSTLNRQRLLQAVRDKGAHLTLVP